ncbi:helix-turn-helix domain-containing protein [Collinsella intestinalis]|uniref:helix-turn-helix transcriptional regulator n=1 Tax=Collinsella intestinalis TaxID=147207 RepID=UPI00195E15AA
MGIRQYRLAKAIGKPESAISEIVNGKRSITVEMAWLLSRALGTTPVFLAEPGVDLSNQDARFVEYAQGCIAGVARGRQRFLKRGCTP